MTFELFKKQVYEWAENSKEGCAIRKRELPKKESSMFLEFSAKISTFFVVVFRQKVFAPLSCKIMPSPGKKSTDAHVNISVAYSSFLKQPHKKIIVPQSGFLIWMS
jgi:hypothetical protein